MRKLLALTFLLASCSEYQTSSTEEIAKLDLIGKCTDLEVPSRFKPIDTYEVEGWLSIDKRTSNNRLETSGILFVSSDELLRRAENQPELGDNNLDEWLAFTDTPAIDIYDFPSYLLNETDWEKLPAIHNYDDENYSVYAERKAECSLTVKSKEGFIPVELLEKERLCFDFIGCLIRGDTIDPLNIRD